MHKVKDVFSIQLYILLWNISQRKQILLIHYQDCLFTEGETCRKNIDAYLNGIMTEAIPKVISINDIANEIERDKELNLLKNVF